MDCSEGTDDRSVQDEGVRPTWNDRGRGGGQRADSRFADALRNNQRADNYTILTVIFALVLFFAAASTRLGRPRSMDLARSGDHTSRHSHVILATFPIEF